MINELYKAFKRNRKNNSHIGYLIKKARKENGFTLADASDNICCVSYLSKIENGNINVAPKILEEIKYRLNVSEKYFKTDDEYKNIILDLIKGMCLSDEKKVNHCFSLVDNKDEVFYADIIPHLFVYMFVCLFFFPLLLQAQLLLSFYLFIFLFF